MQTTAPGLAFRLTLPDEWQGDFSIELAPGLELPPPGRPGKKIGETLLVETASGQHRLVISVGEAEKIDAEALRKAGGAAAKWLSSHAIASVGLEVGPQGKLSAAEALSAFVEGALLRSFSFDELKSGKREAGETTVYVLAAGETGELEAALQHSQSTAAGVNLARRISHRPPNLSNPVTLAETARELAQELGLKCTILDEKALAELGAGAILAVGQGSHTPSHLIVLEYAGADPQAQPVVVVGKAITFDTGGYSLKTRDGMLGMKFDKSGGADVLGVLQAVAALKLPARVVGIIAAAENMVSAAAYRPDDIITSLSGKTIEILSTDAEGRLVLADALTYAQQNYQPKVLLDLATLTGGVVTALGDVRAGLFCNNEALADALFASGERTGERLWRLPMDDEYAELIKGDDSDLRNSSKSRGAHPIQGAIFLKQFVADDVPWAHLDVAGVADTEQEKAYTGKGSTGFGIRLILDYLENR